MTTIAISKTEIAADGRRVGGDNEVLSDDVIKIEVTSGIEGRIILGFTGLLAMRPAVYEWYMRGGLVKGHVPHFSEQNSWRLIVVDTYGVKSCCSQCPYFERYPTPIAFGHDELITTGALLAGASARKAVEIAAARFPGTTGGSILSFNIADSLGLKEWPYRD